MRKLVSVFLVLLVVLALAGCLTPVETGKHKGSLPYEVPLPGEGASGQGFGPEKSVPGTSFW